MQVNTPKDLKNVRVRFFMGLTKRQCICFGIAAAVGFPMYLAVRKFLPTDAAMMVMMAVIFPVFFFALYEKDGKTAEQVLYRMIQQRVLSKGIRRYRSENIYEALEEKEKLRKEIDRLEAKKEGRSKKQKKNCAKEKKHRKKAGAEKA